jgi:Fe/S biogenesis protein NfuA
MIVVSDKARQQIEALLGQEGRQGLMLRAAIAGRGPGGFLYKLGFVGPEEKTADDQVQQVGSFQVLVDSASAPDLEGATIDFVEGPHGTGFNIENPNPLWRDPMAAAIQKVLDDEINPAVGQHGGWVSLLEVKDGRAFIQLGGGCQGCGMVDVTLKQGIEVRIREMVPAIREVVDTTDHAGGNNPYYKPSKGGRSPF